MVGGWRSGPRMSGPMGGHAFSGRNFSHNKGNFARAWNGKNHFHNGRHHRRNFVFIGGPFYDDYYDYGYGGGCGWLYQRALNTGSGYWWRRYELCANY